MPDISPEGWIVVVCALAFGFGLMRLWISTAQDKLADAAAAGDATASAQTPRTWTQVLGVPSSATLDEIGAAYRTKMTAYHPDKVAGLAPELQRMAAVLVQELDAAYAEALRAQTPGH